jgi:KaiC/GvpD/RAD55 family RecA-like ATPase
MRRKIKETQINSFLKSLEPNKIVLFIVNPKKYHSVHAKILKGIIGIRKFSGIYITVNKPYDALVKYLKENKISLNNIFFIDAISKSVSEEIKLTENCLFIPSPSHLTDLGIALTQALEGMKERKNKFLILDSISTLLIYNDFDTVAKFVHFIVSRLRVFGLVGLIISVEKLLDEKMINILMEICDEVVEI